MNSNFSNSLAGYSCIYENAANVSLTLTGDTLAAPQQVISFNTSPANSSSSLTMNHTALTGAGFGIVFAGTVDYMGDYNNFSGLTNPTPFIPDSSTSATLSFAQWQTSTGQDAHSVP